MRLPIIITAGLLLSVGLNMPVMPQPPVEAPHSQASSSNNLNSRRLKFNRRLWDRQNISNYRYTLSNSCFCVEAARGPVVIEVHNGQITSITSADTGKPADPQFFQKYNTILKLFDVIQDAIDRKASSLNVQYNRRRGYPIQINIDYNERISDDELSLTIKDFKRI